MTNVAGLLTATSPKMPRHIKPVCKTSHKIIGIMSSIIPMSFANLFKIRPMELLSKKYMGALRRLLNILSYKFLEATTVSV